jgi:hypothetical protein
MSLIVPRTARAFVASALALGVFAAAPALSSPAPAAALTVRTDVTCAAATAGPVQVASDPEEGGQIARTAKPAPKPKPQISDINVMKTSDKASASMAESSAPASTCPPVQH